MISLSDISAINEQMVEIPGGAIELRDDRIKHQWTVGIASFLLAKFPVTQELYFAITKENTSTFKGDKRPIETVSWRDAVIFFVIYSPEKQDYNLAIIGGMIVKK